MSQDNRQKFIELLKKYRPLDTLSDAALNELVSKLSVTKHPPGTMLFKRDQRNFSHYYVLAGKVDLIDEDFNIQTLSSKQTQALDPLDNADPFSVSAITKTDARILKLSKDQLDLVLTWDQAGSYMVEDLNAAQDEQERDWMSCLLGSSLFQRIPPTNLQLLFTKFKESSFSKGQRVICEGEKGETFYVIQKGTAQVTRIDETKGQTILATLGPGDFFGEESLIGNTVRNASVEMLSNGVLMCLEKEDFKNLLEEPVVKYIKLSDLKQWQVKKKDYIELDVRLPVEISPQDRRNRFLVTLSELRGQLDKFNRETIYVLCPEAGRRAVLGAYLLNESGFQAVVLKATTQSK